MLSRLALGTAQFGLLYGVGNRSGRVTRIEAGRILIAAKAAGLDTLDTAIAYGDSESTLGALGVSEWKLVSKLPGIPDECDDIGEWVDREVRNSLNRLRVARLHAVLLHRPAELFGGKGQQLMEALHGIKRDGLAAKIGVSVYAPDELGPVFARCDLDIVQAPLNILDRRLAESGWAARLKSMGVEVHTRSAFLQGLLLMPKTVRPAKFARWADTWRTWDEWLENNHISPVAACLRYALSISDVDKVVVGVDSVDQFQQIAAAAEAPLNSLPAWPKAEENQTLINPAHWNQL